MLPSFFSDQRIKVSFSVMRNWHILSAPNRKNDLKQIPAIKVWSMMIIVYGHCHLFGYLIPRHDSLSSDNASFF